MMLVENKEQEIITNYILITTDLILFEPSHLISSQAHYIQTLIGHLF